MRFKSLQLPPSLVASVDPCGYFLPLVFYESWDDCRPPGVNGLFLPHVERTTVVICWPKLIQQKKYSCRERKSQGWPLINFHSVFFSVQKMIHLTVQETNRLYAVLSNYFSQKLSMCWSWNDCFKTMILMQPLLLSKLVVTVDRSDFLFIKSIQVDFLSESDIVPGKYIVIF